MDYNSLDVFYTFYNVLIKNSALTFSLTLAKAITSILLVIQFARFYFTVYRVNTETKPISFFELFRPFFLIILVVSYSYVIDAFDSVAKEAESYVYNNFKVESSTEKQLSSIKKESPQNKEDENSTTVIGEMASSLSTISNYFEHPSLLLVKIMEAITAYLDFMVYTFVIVLRFGFLFILRFLGPIFIGLSIYSKFENWWIKWLTAYGLVYLWVICIFLVNFFAAGIALGVYKVLIATGTPDPLVGLSFTSTVTVLVLIKIYLYFKSKALLYKIFA